jgi:hypothetical protein
VTLYEDGTCWLYNYLVSTRGWDHRYLVGRYSLTRCNIDHHSTATVNIDSNNSNVEWQLVMDMMLITTNDLQCKSSGRQRGYPESLFGPPSHQLQTAPLLQLRTSIPHHILFGDNNNGSHQTFSSDTSSVLVPSLLTSASHSHHRHQWYRRVIHGPTSMHPMMTSARNCKEGFSHNTHAIDQKQKMWARKKQTDPKTSTTPTPLTPTTTTTTTTIEKKEVKKKQGSKSSNAIRNAGPTGPCGRVDGWIPDDDNHHDVPLTSTMDMLRWCQSKDASSIHHQSVLLNARRIWYDKEDKSKQIQSSSYLHDHTDITALSSSPTLVSKSPFFSSSKSSSSSVSPSYSLPIIPSSSPLPSSLSSLSSNQSSIAAVASMIRSSKGPIGHVALATPNTQPLFTTRMVDIHDGGDMSHIYRYPRNSNGSGLIVAKPTLFCDHPPSMTSSQTLFAFHNQYIPSPS